MRMEFYKNHLSFESAESIYTLNLISIEIYNICI